MKKKENFIKNDYNLPQTIAKVQPTLILRCFSVIDGNILIFQRCSPTWRLEPQGLIPIVKHGSKNESFKREFLSLCIAACLVFGETMPKTIPFLSKLQNIFR